MRRWDGTDWWFLALVVLLVLGAVLAVLVGAAELWGVV